MTTTTGKGTRRGYVEMTIDDLRRAIATAEREGWGEVKLTDLLADKYALNKGQRIGFSVGQSKGDKAEKAIIENLKELDEVLAYKENAERTLRFSPLLA